MKQLFLTIGWLEFVRNKTRSWLLLIIIVAFSFLLSTCGQSGAQIHISTETTQSSQSLVMPDNSAELQADPRTSLFASMPVVIITSIAFIFGFLVLMTIPFRGKQEWEDGQFQMIAMGDHSFYKVEFTRFLSYLSLAVLFLVTVLFCASVYSWKHDIFTLQSTLNMQLIVAHGFISLMPLMLAFGVFVSAINTAYYRDGNSRLLTIVKYISCSSFFVLTIKTACWFSDAPHNILPSLQLPVEFPGAVQFTATLNWEFLILSLLTAALFIFWSGRVLEEVEA